MLKEEVLVAVDETSKLEEAKPELKGSEILLKEATTMVQKYRKQVSHTGSLVAESMIYSYNKALNDAIITLLKQETKKDEKSVQTKS